MSISPGSESVSTGHWQYCMRVLLYWGWFGLVFYLVLRGGDDSFLYILIPLIIPTSRTPRITRPVLIRVTKGGGCKVYKSAKNQAPGSVSEPGYSLNLRHPLPHHHVPSQLHHPSCWKSRADLKGCSYLFTRSTFLWLPSACLLHPDSFYLKLRHGRINSHTLSLEWSLSSSQSVPALEVKALCLVSCF